MKRVFTLLLAAGSWLYATSIKAQTPNAWTSPTSGNWEDANWSLGELPGPDQAILFTNAGWKAVAIGPNTAANYPQPMNVDSITAASPTNSFNVLLLNYAGYQTPLTANAITLGSSNSSALTTAQLNDIVFSNPAGLPGGMYPAQILSSGEIVPAATTAPMASAPVRQTNGTMDLLVSGEVGRIYGMLVSTDLVHWVVLSTQTNQSGTMTFQDTAAPSYPQRFYRVFVQQ